MNNIFSNILLPGFVLLALDVLFISTTSHLFKKQIFSVQKSPMKVNIYGALFAYVLLIFAISYFVIIPRKDIIYAMLLGFTIYGIYEGTTYALLKDWKLQTLLIDTTWGGILFGLTTYITYALQ
tara:strand:+ start:421 stop:792 length:372 start_codon:yes stop_codon:yes gene_type:complete